MTYLGGPFAATFSALTTIIPPWYLVFSDKNYDYTQEKTCMEWIVLFSAQLTRLCVVHGTVCTVLLVFSSLFATVSKLEKKTEALSELNYKLVKAKELVEEGNRDKTKFMAFLCHELRNPLHAVSNLVDILEDAMIQSENENVQEKSQITDCVKAIKVYSKYMTELTNDVLDMGKLEAGQLRINLENDISLRRILLEKLSDSSGELFRQFGVEFVVAVDESVPEMLITDEIRYFQIVSNITSNAFKFTPKGGKVEVKVEAVSDLSLKFPSCTSDHKDAKPENLISIRTIIRDTGSGISKSVVSKIFTPYTQAPAEELKKSLHGRENLGSGLGLAIAQNIVLQMGGEIQVDSEEGRGTVFSFTVPMFVCQSSVVVNSEPSDIELKERHDSSRSESDKPLLNGHIDDPETKFTRSPRVLVVDDSETNIRILSRFLRKLNPSVVVIEADDGEVALRVYEQESHSINSSSQQVFDLVLMDLTMPVMGGEECTKELRERGYNGPIVATTANNLSEDYWKSLESSGMNAWIVKPFGVAALRECIVKFDVC
ncbi:hypothetical protein HK098_006318 [Nowakowskiella sp. JEL0407]|nr:hypothetical protein HK098_006318 [Nowakowskiella sp. JEL0407]